MARTMACSQLTFLSVNGFLSVFVHNFARRNLISVLTYFYKFNPDTVINTCSLSKSSISSLYSFPIE
mgnify:CR=1 FL=1